MRKGDVTTRFQLSFMHCSHSYSGFVVPLAVVLWKYTSSYRFACFFGELDRVSYTCRPRDLWDEGRQSEAAAQLVLERS